MPASGLKYDRFNSAVWPHQTHFSHTVKSRWADIFDSDSDADSEQTKASNGSGLQEASDQPQATGFSVPVEVCIRMNKKAISVIEEDTPTQRCTMPVDPKNVRTEVELSVGSLQHSQGTCRPCVFARTRLGCHNGTDCLFCHCMHEPKKAERPSREGRKRFQKRFEDAMQWMEKEANWLFNDPHWLELVCAKMGAFLQHKPELKIKVERKLSAHGRSIIISARHP